MDSKFFIGLTGLGILTGAGAYFFEKSFCSPEREQEKLVGCVGGEFLVLGGTIGSWPMVDISDPIGNPAFGLIKLGLFSTTTYLSYKFFRYVKL